MELPENNLFKQNSINPEQDLGTESRDIVFIDTAVPDYESLIANVKPGTQVVILDPARNGVEQITEALKGGKFASVHVISHGSEGSLQLGSSQLSTGNIENYSQQLLQYRYSHRPLHCWGCCR